MQTLIGSPRSRHMRVARALQEQGLHWDRRPEQPQSAAVLAPNPSGNVPVLLDGDTAIPTCLADRHGGLTRPAALPRGARAEPIEAPPDAPPAASTERDPTPPRRDAGPAV